MEWLLLILISVKTIKEYFIINLKFLGTKQIVACFKFVFEKKRRKKKELT